MDEKALTLWFTGLPGSGKTTLASLIAKRLRESGKRTEILDGDGFRKLVGSFGFSREDRKRNVLSVAFTAFMLNRNGIFTTAAFVSPYRSHRQEVRELIGTPFVEIFVDCPLSVCQDRDPKGLYKKAAAGTLTGLTGVDDPYEPPINPEVVVKTAEQTVQESLEHISLFLKDRV